ncbi:putative mitochondrial ATP-dependent zinc metallopeptidase [Leptomonas pyrrhocoris]|uniref:Putative mitochondrial ATP-dependent zinc metallopeptidase n=1 Tax=Leptomonas pyrrhocoris TaxID=157538 RepID=A0A0M9FYH3_LEPPY|nr:putative mitochondrial ATP-dependent zinc metallopeptidase [Leptomonas pyrrhocoris]KPA78537.1 putative mitochondrial ATP-dependent zinc metallopeptidase [Leptomonas pyrrhocoris]|eukprot:XP_015656976.1 putative mitochondrial ATP-dependent zinc metallopeptidase [Leptomonas pyrrhocoris]
MSSTASSDKPEYERGVKDAARHRRATEENWIRPTLGPILWLGVPLLLSYLYLRRVTPAAASTAGGASGNPFQNLMEQMMPIKKRQFRVDVKGTKFADVVGIPEAKAEVRQYVDFLTDPNKFTRLGARLPKGCLLTGEPGTGKTLLAKAVAGEADVAFFSCNGADFIELMGGSGPKRVRELFQEARAAAPSIIFIDEIDAIGSRAGKQGGSVSSEENRTINQLLAELDGLSSSADPIVVLAATNFQDNIDKALLREGRFDRKISIEMPDLAARRELFEHYLNRVCTGDPTGRTKDEEGNDLPLENGVSNKALADQLAHLTPGLSPATVATVVNEAALQSGIAGKPLVQLPSLLEALDNTLMGRKHRNRQSEHSARRTALHEAGHALTAWMLPPVQTVLKISIIPRGHAMGYTQRAGTEFHEYQTNATLFADMVVMLGGRAAEEVLLGNPSAGAMDDLQRATDMALKQMLAFGMSTHTGLLSYHPEYTQAGRDFTIFSNDAQHRAEMEAQRLVAAAHQAAVKIITDNKDKMLRMEEALMEKKELTTKEVETLWGPRPTEPSVEALVQEVIKVTGSYTEESSSSSSRLPSGASPATA